MRSLTADQQRIKQIAEAFATPIIFEPGGWDAHCPDWLRLRVITERIVMIDNGGWKMGTDAEVSCYLFTASLNGPLSSDMTQITLYEAAKQMPQLYDALPATPRELTDYQKRQLDELKYKIRNSQLKRKNISIKEVTMSKRKLIIDEREGRVLLGIMADDSDPIVAPASMTWPQQPVEGAVIPTTLEEAFALVPECLKRATEAWAVSKRGPKYVAPPEPAKVTKPTATKPAATKTKPAATGAATKTTADLPLLAGTEPEPALTEATTEAKAEVKTEVATETAPEAAVAVASPAGKAGALIHAIHTNDAAKVAELTGAGDRVEPAAGDHPAVAVSPSPKPATSPAAVTGEWQYWLEDGRGPYDTVQIAMDVKGLDKATRPQHNRWDRLSTDLKKAIIRKPKAG